MWAVWGVVDTAAGNEILNKGKHTIKLLLHSSSFATLDVINLSQSVS